MIWKKYSLKHKHCSKTPTQTETQFPIPILDDTDSAQLSYRSVARRKTDLMPTIPSPRESSFGSRSSLYCHTPRTPGKHTPVHHNRNNHTNHINDKRMTMHPIHSVVVFDSSSSFISYHFRSRMIFTFIFLPPT